MTHCHDYEHDLKKRYMCWQCLLIRIWTDWKKVVIERPTKETKCEMCEKEQECLKIEVVKWDEEPISDEFKNFSKIREKQKRLICQEKS